MYSEGLQVQQASAMCVCIELLIYLVSQQSSPSDSSPFLLVVIVSLLICCCWSFPPFPFLCPCSSVLVGVVRTAAAAAVTGASVLLLVSPRLSSPFTSTLALCSMMMTKARDRCASWDILDSTEVSVFYASISLCLRVISNYRYVTP